MDLTNKTILVVGGATGIGQATAGVCTAHGAQVIIADYNESAGQQSATQAGRGTRFYPVNVADENSVKSLFARIAEQYGHLDVLIQTAGVLQGAFIPVAEFPLSTFQNVVDINATGSFLCAKYAVPLIKQAGGGVIILVSSVAATGVSSSVAYGTSKGSVTSLGVTLANKLASESIRVNVVHPGGIKTPMKLSVIGREAELRGQSGEQAMTEAAAGSELGEPEGVGKILAWLASDEADYVRGFLTTR
jgi:NAD(P)-dependent dehydrogenase (short-subunit alcohol dehydrogenase family)